MPWSPRKEKESFRIWHKARSNIKSMEENLQRGRWTICERKPDGEEQALLEEKTRDKAVLAAQESLADCAGEDLFPTFVIHNPVNEAVLTMWIENGLRW